MFSVSVFSFSNNKFNPNGPNIETQIVFIDFFFFKKNPTLKCYSNNNSNSKAKYQQITNYLNKHAIKPKTKIKKSKNEWTQIEILRVLETLTTTYLG